MENHKFLRTRLIAILKAALLGAAIGDGLILLDNVTFAMWKHGYLSKSLNEWFGGLAILQSIPSSIISAAIGYEGGLVNEYLVNGLLGAFIFACLAAFRQFFVKRARVSDSPSP